MPRRPAQQAICRNSEAFSSRCPLSVRLDRVEMTVVRAGILIPAARVSVANTTLIKPLPKILLLNLSKRAKCLRGGRRCLLKVLLFDRSVLLLGFAVKNRQ